MNLVNHTALAAELNTQRDLQGFEYLLLLAKGTYRMPLNGEVAELLGSQIPIHFADTATEEPGLSSPLYECEMVPPKPACDVLLLGSAYAPRQAPIRSVSVGLEVSGKFSKNFVVHGERCWNAGILSLGLSQAQPFVQQPLTYDIAFGGADLARDVDASLQEAYASNPVGKGYAKSVGRNLDGKATAQTESLRNPIRYPSEKYQPMSFGPVGRSWSPRVGYAGTYDQSWIEERYPLLPKDFDARYFQAAPADQQVASLATGDKVVLSNLVHPSLSVHGQVRFALPDLSLQCFVYPRNGTRICLDMRPDTLMLEPDQQRFSILWKATYTLGNDPFSVRLIELGDRRKLHFIRVSLDEIKGQLPSKNERI